MYIIVVGAGKVGYYLIQLLLEEGHDTVVIEKDVSICQKISKELDVVCIQGDATEPSILEKAGISECDALVSLTGQDETNMVVSLLAKELGAKQIATRIEKVQYDEKVLNKLGIDIVIHPEAAAAGYIEELVTKPEVLDLAFISRGQAEIMEIKLGADSKLVGKKIKDINYPAGSAIVALYEDSQLVIPDPEYVFKPDTKLLVLAKTEVADKVRRMLK